MSSKLNLTFRYIPLTIYLIIIFTFLLVSQGTNGIFDFWAEMASNISIDLVSWFLAGMYVVMFCVLVVIIRLFIVRYSFQSMKDFPHTDTWEAIQLRILFSSFIIPTIIGLSFTFMPEIVSVIFYRYLLIIWVIFTFLPDFSYYFYWVSQSTT